MQLNASNIQKMLRRQCGVPAFNNRKALATSGTAHCTRFPNVDRGWLPGGKRNDMAPYVASVSSHTDSSATMEREEVISLLETSLGGKRATGLPRSVRMA